MNSSFVGKRRIYDFKSFPGHLKKYAPKMLQTKNKSNTVWSHRTDTNWLIHAQLTYCYSLFVIWRGEKIDCLGLLEMQQITQFYIVTWLDVLAVNHIVQFYSVFFLSLSSFLLLLCYDFSNFAVYTPVNVLYSHIKRELERNATAEEKKKHIKEIAISRLGLLKWAKY